MSATPAYAVVSMLRGFRTALRLRGQRGELAAKSVGVASPTKAQRIFNAGLCGNALVLAESVSY